jgi:hypothetical protein
MFALSYTATLVNELDHVNLHGLTTVAKRLSSSLASRFSQPARSYPKCRLLNKPIGIRGCRIDSQMSNCAVLRCRPTDSVFRIRPARPEALKPWVHPDRRFQNPRLPFPNANTRESPESTLQVGCIAVRWRLAISSLNLRTGVGHYSSFSFPDVGRSCKTFDLA